MPATYFALGTTLANMVNVETLVDQPPHVLEDGAAALTGAILTTLMDGSTRRDGFINHNWRFDFESREQFNALVYAITGAWFTVNSRQVYITTIDETGRYSPFLCYAGKPYPQDNYRVSEGGWVREIVVPLSNLTLQSATKTTTYTITTSDRLIYGDTSGGNFTVTLPAAATVTPNTVYSIHKTAAANTLTIEGDGAETINGSANVTLTALNSRYDLVSDGSAWTSVTA